MNALVHWLGRAGLIGALLLVLIGCGSAPTVQGENQSVGDARPNETTGLDQELLRQVDEAIAAAQARGEDVATAQQLRDSAVSVAAAGNAAEANGNLKLAAQLVGVLRPIGDVALPDPNSQQVAPPPAVASVNQGELLLSASFENDAALQRWERIGPDIPTGTPLWEVRDGLLVQRGVDGVDAVDEQTGLVTGEETWQDVTVQASVLARDTREVGLIVRQQGESFYRFRALVIGTGGNNGNYILEKVVDGQVSQIAAFDGAELSANTWHTLSVTVAGSTITASVDGVEVGSAQDSTLKAGRAGVSTLAMSGAYFANVQVTRR